MTREKDRNIGCECPEEVMTKIAWTPEDSEYEVRDCYMLGYGDDEWCDSCRRVYR